VATLQRKRGSLSEAISTANQVVAQGGAPARTAHMLLAECAVVQGRYDDALQHYDLGRKSQKFADPAAEMRSDGAFSLGIASALTYADRPQEVRPHLDFAYECLGADPKLSVWCDCIALRLRAFDGDRASLTPHMRKLETDAAPYANDRNTKAWVQPTIGWALIRVQDYQAALPYLEAYLQSPPDPVWEPRTYYGIGLCHAGMGNNDAARAAFEKAVARRLDTLHTRIANAALAALDEGRSPLPA